MYSYFIGAKEEADVIVANFSVGEESVYDINSTNMKNHERIWFMFIVIVYSDILKKFMWTTYYSGNKK